MKIRKLLPVLVCLLLVATHLPLGAADWPSLRWDFTGYDSTSGGPFPEAFDIWGVPNSPAIGNDGTVYAGSLNGYFFALYPNGNLKWVNSDVGGSFGQTPAISDDGIIYASNGPGLFAFDPDDGKVLWSYYAPCQFMGAPAIARDGTVYIGSNTDRLFAFNRTLNKKWEFSGYGHPYDQADNYGSFANPVIGVDGTIYCIQIRMQMDPLTGNTTDEGGCLHTIKPNGDFGPWHWIKDSLKPEYSPAIDKGSIYVGGYDGRLYSVSLEQGSVNWSHAMQMSGPTGAPVIGADGTVYAAYGNILYGLDPTDGTHRWSQMAPPDMWIRTPAIGADGKIYFGTFGFIGDDFGGGIFFATPGAYNYWLSLGGQVHSSPAIVKDGDQGVLYIGSGEAVSAFNVDSPGVAESPWPMDRANLKRNARYGDAMIRMLLASREMVIACKFPINIQTSLVSKLDAAQQSLIKEKVKPAKNQVEAFIHEVRALRGKKILIQDADKLIIAAQRIASFL